MATIGLHDFLQRQTHSQGADILKTIMSNYYDSYVGSLERKIAEKSDRLEDLHLEAAIDAQLTSVTSATTAASSRANAVGSDMEESLPDHFDKDDVNPYAVSNCLSPYVPACSKKISAFMTFARIHGDDVLLDIGCGDGRVCVAAAKLTGCRTIGLDVSPPCIDRAKELAEEECVTNRCQFFQADATVDPEELLSGKRYCYQSINVLYALLSPMSHVNRIVGTCFGFAYGDQSLALYISHLAASARSATIETRSSRSKNRYTYLPPHG